jgi:hypothetical protein
LARIGAVLALCVASPFAPRVPLGPAVVLMAAALVGLGAIRLVMAAEFLASRRRDTAVVVLRLARFCHDLTLALFLLALLYVVHPF